MTSGDPLVPLAEATDVTRVGGKAVALAHAAGAGHRVPDGVVITAAAAAAFASGTSPADRAQLVGLVDRLGGCVAVRSSGIAEDAPGASFAGQYETVLGIQSHGELVEAVGRCVRSATSDAVVDYADHARVAGPGIAVLVQRMLSPTAAGVAFSVDPVSGDDHVVIEATTGIGDALLAGEDTGERWLVGSEPEPDSEKPTVLDTAGAEEIALTCRSLAALRGRAVDIEWAIEDGQLWVLQVRPVTALPVEPVDKLDERKTFLRDERVARPIHPLTFTSWFPVHADVFAQVFEEFGLPVSGLDHRYHLCRVYTRTAPLIDVGRDSGTPPAAVLRLLIRVVPVMRRRVANARRWEGEAEIEALIDAWEGRGRAQAAGTIATLRERPLSSMSDDKIADHVYDVMTLLHSVALDHFRLAVAAMMIPMGRLGLFVEERLGWSSHEVFDLVQGFGDATVARTRALHELADRLGPDGVDRALAHPPTLLAHPAVAEYLDRFGTPFIWISRRRPKPPLQASSPTTCVATGTLFGLGARLVREPLRSRPNSGRSLRSARAKTGPRSRECSRSLAEADPSTTRPRPPSCRCWP